MSAGELDREITLEFVTQGQTSSGDPTEAWGSATTVWARVLGLSGREYFAAQAAQVLAEEMLTFKIYFRDDVRPGTARVTYNSRIYNIRRVVEIGRREYLVIYADTAEA